MKDGRTRELLRGARGELGVGGRLDLAVWGRIQFEAAVGEVRLHTGDFVPRLLEWLYPDARSATPNSAHRAVAALVPERVDRIVTTNFDECLEVAISDSRLTVIAPIDGPFTLQPVGILKVHGTISHRDSVAADPEGLRRRAADPNWLESLVATLAGRDVLFVGYSFSDHFDINPALARAAQEPGTRFFAAIGGRTDASEISVPLSGYVRHDLAQPANNILVHLAERTGFPRPPAVGMPDAALAAEAIRSRAETLLADLEVTVGQRLQALAALYYWLEYGSRALRYFEVAAQTGSSTVDGHILARAYLRARRYRAAVALFDHELQALSAAGEASSVERSTLLHEADLCIGAGHCASAGGRRRLAASYYRRARRAMREAESETTGLDPYLADQFYRSQAGWEIGAAQRCHDQTDRERHLAAAEAWLDRLASVHGLSLTMQPLGTLDHARIALVRGQRSLAVGLVRNARTRLGPWGDPHGVAVCNRMEAIALGQRDVLWDVARDAWRRGQRLEAAKSVGDVVATFVSSAHLPLWLRLRDRLINAWDLAKESETRLRRR